MEYTTVNHWDEELWKRASFIYDQAFKEKGAKPEKVIRNMFNKDICFLHLGIENSQVIAMAITGKLKGTQALLIDYLAVHVESQNKGIGLNFMEYIKEWSRENEKFDSMIIEVESENDPENHNRILFWKNCGFTLTNYIHHYIWVPEPYQAMFVKLLPNALLPSSGEELFNYISNFHKASYQGA
ncbi:GNAT family N-acetyltransferase [Neobacillus sp. PS3-40]|uniref:GNAT family N-acetyltransferase n=1 Tax=Neobacillus sp. PS3-40 TaxID=3070679 RepID=UPI0027DFBFF0|nr:GNAT family N-acetyltransferase [Neobacillus sp. PS3-40]WML44445.1 GNAT family N-acetyltransferase [Neobacillus sp. PS3-40]